MDTRLRAAVIAGCKESFRLEELSRDGVITAEDVGTLPGWKKRELLIMRETLDF